jgi:hypothetical protein
MKTLLVQPLEEHWRSTFPARSQLASVVRNGGIRYTALSTVGPTCLNMRVQHEVDGKLGPSPAAP